MNNGHTRESKHRIAVLEDQDVETFVAFCEYAYTGDYNVPQAPIPRLDERTRIGASETATSPAKSWREIHRTDSMSTGVPPPAPSPPPSVGSASRRAQAPAAPEQAIEDDSPAEPAVEEQQPATEEAPSTEANDASNQPEESNLSNTAEGEVEPESVPEPEADADAGPADEADEWGSSPASTKKGKKANKKKKKGGSKPAEEPALHLTPPSTPPLEASPEVQEVSMEAEASEQPREHTLEESAQPTEAAPMEESSEAMPSPEAGTEQEADSAPAEEWSEPAESAPVEDTPTRDEWQEAESGIDSQEEQKEAPQKPFIDMSFAKQSRSDSSPRTPGQSLWDEFAELDYNDETPDSFLPTPDSSTADLPYLTFHAKVYVFATRYLIPALAQLCLRKLHRDLLSLTFEDAESMNPMLDSQPLIGLVALQVPMVLDLLQYSYTKTTRLEPIIPNSATQLRENELRRLVVHYAACKVKELARYHLPGDSGAATPAVRPMDASATRTERPPVKSLRVLLDMTPELASDLVYRMM
ncbi:uncharacterized protein N7483_005896 [Penicillium malachiteum]|uniref:uncharacterized protein n=1 Tax=Penicillium malachiteum TaxID=1324776 RepID=UPI0025477839|nr:uncharacterized protein N7483_005896 [Penicillium malachiteum]KAJ5731388.1 hypothetical protein N7483_005896 [Penicillium malachiteum]